MSAAGRRTSRRRPARQSMTRNLARGCVRACRIVLDGEGSMKGIIIAGGFGTRLKPLTYNRPKHLLPVANRPFLEYQVALLKRHGIREILFATNYFADQIERRFGDGSACGVSLRYAGETTPLGTAGALPHPAAIPPPAAR